MAEFAVNNKIYLTTKLYLFIANYSKKLRIVADIRKKRKIEKTTTFAKRLKKVQEKTRVALKKTQKEWKQSNTKYKELGV